MVLITILRSQKQIEYQLLQGLDDYDTLFAARHGRGALDPVPKVGEQITTTSLGIQPPMVGPRIDQSNGKNDAHSW